MKKSLVALAALAATGAFAQSSVTLYGRLDLGMINQKTTVQTAPNVSTSTKVFDLAGAQGTKTGGRLGVNGTEDLGGGLKAGFVIETRVNPDKSPNVAGGLVQGTFGATRQANLNLTGDFGTVVLGTYLNAFDDLRYAHSPNIAGLAGGDTFAAFGASARLTERAENSLGFASPSFGGVKLRASVISRKNNGDIQTPKASATGLTVTNGVVATGITTAQKTQGFGFAAGYDNGPLSVLGVFGTAKQTDLTAGTLTPTLGKINDYGFNVKYDLGVAVPYFIYEAGKLTSSAPGFFNKTSGFEVGAKFPLGAFTPYVTFNAMKNTTNAPSKEKVRAFQIGTNYDVSKRTSLYAALGSDKKSVSVAGTATKRTGFALGLVHKF